MERKIGHLANGEIPIGKMSEIFQGWNAYAQWADSYNLRLRVLEKISEVV